VMPVLPGITDAPEMIEELVRAVKVADASYISACALRLQAAARDRYLPFIAAEFPELAAKYRRAYATGYQVSERYREGLKERFQVVCERNGVAFGRYNRPEEEDDDETELVVASAQLGLQI
jgi:DNA repair photolyase